MKSLAHYWYQQNLLAWLLLPLSWLFCVVAVTRRKIYKSGLKKSYSAEVPVVVIGNIVVGGSGKTPLLIAICEYLKDNGLKPGVVSRGYGGTATGLKQVREDDPASLVGDEPLMIHQRTGVPVVIGADRVAAVSSLLAHNQCDIVLSDDGLQHYRMNRELEIAVVDTGRNFGNGFCLPAGPLREPMSRLADVDMIVYNDTGADTDNVSSDTDTCAYTLKIVDLSHLSMGEQSSLPSFAGKTVHAVAGIGNPSRFFAQLRNNGINIVEHAFPDHHVFTQDDFSGWDTDCIIMTEKDAVKCLALSLPEAWVVRVRADMSATLVSQLNSKLLPLVKKI